jgi:F-type H+-transporting ATPase subunit gamma
MQNLETLKRSIKSAEDLGSVVRTMKTMSAVSIRQYETAAKSLSVYADTIETGLTMLLPNLDDESQTTGPHSERTGAIIFGSDQGMCGQFNEQISEFSVEYLRTHRPDIAPAICIGYRVADRLSQHGLQTDRTLRLPGTAVGITGFVQELLPVIDAWRATHQIDHILVFHNRRLTASTWKPFAVQLLPLRLNRLRHRDHPSNPGRSRPLWTMNSGVLFSRLVKQFLFVSLFRACAESLAGENASRIAAMQAAERNIKDRLHLLKAEYAQQRQTTITEELLDVVTGFEALKKEL